MYNDLEVGSYLTWHWGDRIGSSRTRASTAIPSAFHATLRRDDLSRDAWEAFLARFGVTTALVSFPDLNPRAALFDPRRWALVFRDGEALVFAARRPEFAALIARDELPLTFSYAREAGVTPQPLARRPAGSPVADCDWQKRLGDALLELGDEAGARAAYAAAAGAPDCRDPADAPRRRVPAAIWRSRTATRRPPSRPTPGSPSPTCAPTAAWRSCRSGGPREAEVDLTAALAADPAQPEARLAQAFAFEALRPLGRRRRRLPRLHRAGPPTPGRRPRRVAER